MFFFRIQYICINFSLASSCTATEGAQWAVIMGLGGILLTKKEKKRKEKNQLK